MRERVGIVSTGLCTPFGGLEASWEAVLAGKSAVGPIAIFDPSGLPTTIAAEATITAEMLEGLGLDERKVAREYGRFVLLALAAAQEAMEPLLADPAYIDALKADGRALRWGVMVGNGGCGLPDFEKLAIDLHKNPQMLMGKERMGHMLTILKFLINMPTGRLAIKYGLRGPNATTGDACAASLKALINAVRTIRAGDADVMLVVGTEATASSKAAMAAFNLMNPRPGKSGAMSPRNDDPAGASRPYAADRDGFVKGEAAAVAVLMSESYIRANFPSLLPNVVWVAGYGDTNDASNMFDPQPHEDGNPSGAYEAMRLAVEMSGKSTISVDALMAHATSTPAGDTAEAGAIRALFGANAEVLEVYASKSHFGHTLGAAGMLSVVLGCKAIATGKLPRTLNLTEENLDPDCAGLGHFLRVLKPIRTVLVNAFGFGGGTNASVYLVSE